MKLKITTPDRNIFEGEITSVSIPTENGTETIHSNKAIPMVTAIKPGLIKIIPANHLHDTHEFVIAKNEIIISISKGMTFVDGTTIRIVASQATTIPNHSKDSLEKTKEDIELHIKDLRNQWSIEQLEIYMTKLQKINADISLEAIKQCA